MKAAPPNRGPTGPTGSTGPAPAPPLSVLERQVLDRITPTQAEQQALQGVAADLAARLDAELQREGVPGQASVQGSVAKGTWLRGGADLDCFLLLDPAVPQERLEQVSLAIGPRVLSGSHKRYAQHPYLIGTFRGLQVDLVPAYRVASATARMSAVDRTPFHTAWVRAALGGREGEVRLAKKWMKGIGAYGAQTALGGFSGYLVEVLVARFGSFAGLVDWLAADARPRRIALGADEVSDDVACLVVVDPVDPARNCAAAVQEPTLAQALDAARAYRAAPHARFFDPSPARAEPSTALHAALAQRNEGWMGLLLRPRTDRLDIVFPQFQKAARTVESALEAAGFPVRRATATADAREEQVLLQWLASGAELPPTRVHAGPPDSGAPNVERFRAKWSTHPDAAGPVRKGADGRLAVELLVRHRTAPTWLAAHLPGLPLGRHVQDAMPGSRLLDDPASVPDEWAPVVADLVLARRPWER
ncbi:MAG TPA: CCA tRNA nucleotidyltransferase [Candidatus Thermoplasmatota archaeon]|nr:CCA tRNA nucleotidyltransferase [Candidatus Thermoplasmatota archaeon]